MSILSKLYHEWYDPENGYREEGEEKYARYDELMEQVEKKLGREFAEKLRASAFHVADIVACNDFQAGFRLGALLMLELQIPPAPISTAQQG